MPTIYVIAGPNGVGKTTFAEKYLPQVIHQLDFVNADLIAKGLSPFDPDSVSVEAGRTALLRIRELLSERKSFTWETTLSGRTAVAWLRGAKQTGYSIKGYFLWVRNIEITLQRIRRRVIEGGHDIPVEVSRRRFFKTFQNFMGIYRPLFDSWKIIDNEGAARLLAAEKCGKLVIRDRARFDAMLRDAGVSYEDDN